AVRFVSSLRWQHFALHRSPLALGDMARSMFSSQALLHKYRYPRTRAIALPGAKTVLSLARFFIGFIDCAPKVRQRFGIGLWKQFTGICAAGFRHGLDARAYYLFELYRPEQMQCAGGYVTRYETKNGLFKILTWQLPKHNRRTSLGDKLAVHEMCERNDIPTPALLGIAKKGEVKLLCDPKTSLDQDLFIKLAKAKGSRGVERWKRIGPNRYRDHKGTEFSLEQGLARLAERSKSETLMIQPHIANHPAIADYARESLITIRVITCLDEANQPVITHGFLRVVSKLESDWPHKIELGSAIDLETGALDLMTGDKDNTRFEWYRDHPVTGAPVLGRTLPCWDEVKTVALAAHRACPDRLIVGWDIAISPEGPVLLEGNAYADVDFLQRVHRCPFGASPVGPLLYARLVDLQHRIATGTVRGADDYD
ncbi:MAG: sugar-transfer associated ATP-grasp domain-containing protein, partial [Dongiaceae bacterium]